jgi:hypothetical protein
MNLSSWATTSRGFNAASKAELFSGMSPSCWKLFHVKKISKNQLKKYERKERTTQLHTSGTATLGMSLKLRIAGYAATSLLGIRRRLEIEKTADRASILVMLFR